MILDENEEMELGIDDVEMDHEGENECKELDISLDEPKNIIKNENGVVYDFKELDIQKNEFLNTVRPEALYLKGVDQMSTDDVKEYCITYYPAVSPSIEWIDDSSCNLVYSDASTALSVLSSISCSKVDTLYVSSLVPAKTCLKYNNAQLFIRHSSISDKKMPGARERSRWYLFHQHPSEKRYISYRRKQNTSRRFGPYKYSRDQSNLEVNFLSKKDKPVLSSTLHGSSFLNSNCDRQTLEDSLSLSRTSLKSNIELFPEKLANLTSNELFPKKLVKLDHRKNSTEGSNEVSHKELFPEKLNFQRHVSYFSSNNTTIEKTPFILNIKGSSKRRNKATDMF
ncbi:hypothetical protein T552_02087 [Pneumocystis carinii B80]|uniref:Nuclear cap-binding protein subunit 3 n=1 Tax=Pneumocystis carinii (strain B80) TaxID=1408658 RepID=A0A0W4ZGZ7_PNEC8|nr:hypothetical protein T552_02087 [Pneumocystis carinii B80]KTW27646.1 hypothetical protein T552_02087 [Pneumocystis carinii B80]